MFLSQEKIDKTIDDIFSNFLYDGLECESEEEYKEIELLYEKYFRPALAEAKSKYLREKSATEMSVESSDLIECLYAYANSRGVSYPHLKPLYDALETYYIKNEPKLACDNKLDSYDILKASEKLFHHLDNVDFNDDDEEDWEESQDSKEIREFLTNIIIECQKDLREQAVSAKKKMR